MKKCELCARSILQQHTYYCSRDCQLKDWPIHKIRHRAWLASPFRCHTWHVIRLQRQASSRTNLPARVPGNPRTQWPGVDHSMAALARADGVEWAPAVTVTAGVVAAQRSPRMPRTCVTMRAWFVGGSAGPGEALEGLRFHTTISRRFRTPTSRSGSAHSGPALQI